MLSDLDSEVLADVPAPQLSSFPAANGAAGRGFPWRRTNPPGDGPPPHGAGGLLVVSPEDSHALVGPTPAAMPSGLEMGAPYWRSCFCRVASSGTAPFCQLLEPYRPWFIN